MENLDVIEKPFSGLNPSAKGKKWAKPVRVDLDQPHPRTLFDKFLIVQGTGGAALSRQSPFAIKKYFNGVESVKLLQSGDYLIETKSDQQSQHFLNMERLGECHIRVKPHFGLNRIKGVIQSDSLKYDVSREQLIDELKDIGVVDCYFHQKRQPDGSMENNGRVTLTFKGQHCPTKVTICEWLHCKVFEYIPNPMRCFQCQKFGHVSKNCKGKKRCGNCGGEYHENCGEPSQCLNCGGDHAAYDRSCPQWKQEKEIQKIKVKQNISYNEAKNRITSNRVSQEKPYAVIAQASPAANNAMQGEKNQFHEMIKSMQIVLTQLSNKIDVLSQRMEALEKQTKPKEHREERKRNRDENADSNITEENRSKRMSILTKLKSQTSYIIKECSS